jgi:hypothetical protein
VITGFLKMADDSAGQDMLKAIQMALPTRADYVRDYQGLERLKLEQFAVPGGE